MSIPNIPAADPPALQSDGSYVGPSQCESTYSEYKPPVPYGEQQDISEALYFEDGFKEVVGYLTEGRYLVFEAYGKALTNGDSAVIITEAKPNHNDKSQRWVLHYSGGEESGEFTVSSALDGKWLAAGGKLQSSEADAAPLKIQFLGNGKGYTIQYAEDATFVNIGDEHVELADTCQLGFSVFSVTYHD